MVLKGNSLSGEERKIVSTRVYASEFVHFKKLCEYEGKAVNAKLREMIKTEIKRESKKIGELHLIKEKEGIDRRLAFSSIRGIARNSEIKREDFRRGI